MKAHNVLTLNRQILYLAGPSILSNLSVPLLSSVDTALVGHLEEIYYLGAIAIGTMIFNFLYLGFGFLRMGTTGLTAQAVGDGNERHVILTLVRSLLVALTLGVGLILLQTPIETISFKLVQTSADVEAYARSYFNIRILAAPATLALFAFHGWFLGMQNAHYPLILAVMGNLANIGLNVLFIQVFDLKSDGIALGTVLAQYFGLILALGLFGRKYRHYLSQIIPSQILDWQALQRFFSVNRDIFIRTVCLVFSFTYFTAMSAQFGDRILAVNTILMQFWTILAYGIDGFAFAGESLAGRYLGAKDAVNLRRTVIFSFAWGLGFGLIFMGVYAAWDRELIAIFTDKPDLIDLALVYVAWTIAAPLVNSIAFIWDGIFIGTTATAAMRNAMLVCTFLVFLPTFHLTRAWLDNHSLWLAMTLLMVMRGLTLTLLAKKHVFGQLRAE